MHKLSPSYLQKSAYGSIPIEPTETRPGSNFPKSRVAFTRYNQLSETPTKQYQWLAQNILAKLQFNDAITYLSRPCGNHTITRFRGTDYPQPRIIISRSTYAKYHRITRKNSAYWQINTSELFPNTCLIQVPGCKVTRSADHLSLGLGQSSLAILLSPNSFDS